MHEGGGRSDKLGLFSNMVESWENIDSSDRQEINYNFSVVSENRSRSGDWNGFGHHKIWSISVAPQVNAAAALAQKSIHLSVSQFNSIWIKQGLFVQAVCILQPSGNGGRHESKGFIPFWYAKAFVFQVAPSTISPDTEMQYGQF